MKKQFVVSWTQPSWHQQWLTVEAETEEEAVKKVKAMAPISQAEGDKYLHHGDQQDFQIDTTRTKLLPKPESTITITMEFEITNQQLSDLMVTALEDGINYWCSGCDVVEPDKNLRPSDAVLQDKWCLSFKDSDPMVAILLDKEGLLNGVKKTMEWGNFATVEDLMDGHDAETADVMIQFALFEEIVYG